MKKLRVSFNDEQDYFKITIDFKKVLRSCCRESLYQADFDHNCEISVSFVNNERIREINRDFRNIDSATDVLSFPLADNREFDINPDSGCYELGDIIISTERAAEQANELGHSTEREIAFLVVHSMLHLLGYDHPDEDSEQTAQMRQLQKVIISKIEQEFEL